MEATGEGGREQLFRVGAATGTTQFLRHAQLHVEHAVVGAGHA
jgi:hypothetical protein